MTGKLTGHCDGCTFHILAGITGNVSVNDESLSAGQFALLPAALGTYTLTGRGALLRASVPSLRR